MKTMIRLAAPAFLALAFAQGADAANEVLRLKSFVVSPGEAAQQSTVTFSGVVEVVCQDTSGDGGCSGSVTSNLTEPLPDGACVDTSGDGGCADAPSAAAVTCQEAGKVWVYVTSFNGRTISDRSGACASTSGAFSGKMPTLSHATRTRIDAYASLTPLNALPAADPENADAHTWFMSSYTVSAPVAVAIQSLSCMPQALPGGAQATATVTMTKAIGTAQTIDLSGSSAYTTTPKTLTIPANATKASFTITAGRPPADATASLKAADKTSSQTCTIKILKVG
jgi:hypothetical protein